MSYSNIVKKCRDTGYSKLCKIVYYKLKGSWDYQILVYNDVEVKQMWEEGEEFGFLKIFIEVREYNDSIRENANINKSTRVGSNSNAPEVEGGTGKNTCNEN